MAEMPIPQVDPQQQPLDPSTNPDGSATVDMDETPLEIEEMDDGSAVVYENEEFKGPDEDEDFYSNLAETVKLSELDTISLRYLDMIDKDKQAREQRDKQYEDGLRRTGLGNDSPGGANFQGASKVVHPVMAEACVDFAARAIKELFPADGPVRTNIIGEATEEKSDIAERKRDYMNWQLTEQIVEFRDEEEQLLTQLPLGGSQFMKLWWDDKKKRPCAEFVPIDNILLPFAAGSFYTAQRVTEIQDISEWEFKNRIDRGLYKDVDFIRSVMEPDPTRPEKANQKIEGKEYQDNSDGLRRVFHIYTWLELDDDKRTKGESAPYIMMIDDNGRDVLGLYRNWEEGDESMEKLDWITEYKFIPWRGAYAIGLPHLIGGLTAALTGTLRALLDSAHINNAATMLKLKGAKISGQSQTVEVTQITEIEGAPGVNDVRALAMPMPFNPPSQVLFTLLGWLTSAAKGVVTTTEEKIADINANAPVGTTQALIEQGAAVFSAIHARLHDSQRRMLMILQRINRWYLDDQKKNYIVEDLGVKKDDFRRNGDVLPVSDPHIFSETQRMAQMQAVFAMMKDNPNLFDARAVISRALKQMKVPNIAELMPEYSKPMELNAADENASMTMGRHATAYPRQDHIAHIKTHLLYANDPVLGGNPIIAPSFIPAVLEHLKQHLSLYYTDVVKHYSTVPINQHKIKYEDNKLAPEIDRLIAVASQHVALDSQKSLGSIVPMIQKLQQVMNGFQAQPPMDGEAQAVLQASMAETQRRAARDKADIQIKQAQIAQDIQEQQRKEQFEAAMNTENNLTDERMKTLGLTVEAARLKHEQSQTATDLQDVLQRNLKGEQQ